MRSGNPLINSTVQTHLNFTENREEMKSSIKNLRCFGKAGTTKGLADGLASALQLSKAAVNPDSSKCRRDAIKICILLREYNEIVRIFLMFQGIIIFNNNATCMSLQNSYYNCIYFSAITTIPGADPGFQKGGWMADHIY